MRLTTIGLMVLMAAVLCTSAVYAGNRMAGGPLDLGPVDAVGQWLLGSTAATVVDGADDQAAMDHPATRDDVLAEYGAPMQISDGGDQWWYDDLIVMFRDDRVVGWVPVRMSRVDDEQAAPDLDRPLSTAFRATRGEQVVVEHRAADEAKIRVSPSGGSRNFRSRSDEGSRYLDRYKPGVARSGTFRSSTMRQKC